MDLPYNAYAFKLDRVAGNGMQDKCILYKARASVVNLADAVPGSTWGPVPTPIALDPSLVRVYKKEEKNEEMKEEDSEAMEGAVELAIASTAGVPEMTTEVLDNSANESTVAMDEVEPSVMAAVDKAPSPEHQQQQKKKTKNKSSDENDNDDEAEDAADSYFTSSSASGANEVVRGMDPTVSVEVPEGSEVPALCIELVGNRFLRRMVRILTVSHIVCLLFIVRFVLFWLRHEYSRQLSQTGHSCG